jgi:hypothetical protein
MVAVVTAVQARSDLGLLAPVVSDHSLATALASGGVVAMATLAWQMRYQRSAWERAAAEPLIVDSRGETRAPESDTV